MQLKNFNSPHSTGAILLLLLVVIEILFQTHWFHEFKHLATWIYFFAGLGIGFIPLFARIENRTRISNQSNYKLLLFFFLIIGVLLYLKFPSILQAWPLDYKTADMLPVMEIMSERLINGDSVYEWIPEIWTGRQPIYLPAMYLPYVPAVFLEIDMRWIHFIFILLGIFFCWRLLKPKEHQNTLALLCIIPLALLLWYLVLVYSTFLGISEEPIVVGYYLLLGYALLNKKPVFLGIAISLCMLSRYALAFWVICFLAYLFFFVSKKKAFMIGTTTLAFSTFLLWLGDGLGRIKLLFFDLGGRYLENLSSPRAAFGVKDLPHRNLGFAKYVPYEQLPIFHQFHFWLTLITPIALFAAYHRWKDRISSTLFPICSLKVCLVIFLQFYLPAFFLFILYLYIFIAQHFIRLLESARRKLAKALMRSYGNMSHPEFWLQSHFFVEPASSRQELQYNFDCLQQSKSSFKSPELQRRRSLLVPSPRLRQPKARE